MQPPLFGSAAVCLLAALSALISEQAAHAAITRLPRLPGLLLDNAAHGAVAASLWAGGLLILELGGSRVPAAACALLPLRAAAATASPALAELLAQVASAYALGCVLDADHFIAARSLRLGAALTLPSRPFGHAAAFVVAAAAAAGLVSPRSPLWLLLITSWGSHQLRDAMRRGLWLWPAGHTRPLPPALYYAFAALAPLLVAVTLHRLYGGEPTLPRSSSSDNEGAAGGWASVASGSGWGAGAAARRSSGAGALPTSVVNV